jgi:hypothetical protein
MNAGSRHDFFAELVTTALEVQRGSTEEEFKAFMTDTCQLLEPPEWNLLHESVIHNPQHHEGKQTHEDHI